MWGSLKSISLFKMDGWGETFVDSPTILTWLVALSLAGSVTRLHSGQLKAKREIASHLYLRSKFTVLSHSFLCVCVCCVCVCCVCVCVCDVVCVCGVCGCVVCAALCQLSSYICHRLRQDLLLSSLLRYPRNPPFYVPAQQAVDRWPHSPNFPLGFKEPKPGSSCMHGKHFNTGAIF